MWKNNHWQSYLLLFAVFLILSGCAKRINQASSQPFDDTPSRLPLYHGQPAYSDSFDNEKYVSLLPQNINLGREKVILVDPNKYAWGAYDADGKLIRGGIATGGADFCKDEGRPCRTTPGSFRIYSLGDEGCISRTYPLGKGGSLMPYCLFFNKGQSLHGTPDQMMTEENISHGCIHMRIPDVKWLRYNFAKVGTKVVILPY